MPTASVAPSFHELVRVNNLVQRAPQLAGRVDHQYLMLTVPRYPRVRGRPTRIPTPRPIPLALLSPSQRLAQGSLTDGRIQHHERVAVRAHHTNDVALIAQHHRRARHARPSLANSAASTALLLRTACFARLLAESPTVDTNHGSASPFPAALSPTTRGVLPPGWLRNAAVVAVRIIRPCITYCTTALSSSLNDTNHAAKRPFVRVVCVIDLDGIVGGIARSSPLCLREPRATTAAASAASAAAPEVRATPPHDGLRARAIKVHDTRADAHPAQQRGAVRRSDPPPPPNAPRRKVRGARRVEARAPRSLEGALEARQRRRAAIEPRDG
mmetsp:Transcript_21141/g.65532  ORF Transcript_21141/g.65532 Transcript_21141/m.65532 type:complete len:328 (-) Transcript_21141:147-1130(-)